MAKITFDRVSFCYPKVYTSVFENVSFSIDADWKLGLTGRNGRGKTTLLKIMNGELQQTNGTIKRDVNVEYFPYQYSGEVKITLDVIKECIGNLYSLEQQLDDAVMLEEYIRLDGFQMEGKIRKEAARIGLKENVLSRSFETLSGGEQTKALIIALFLKSNSFVLLDEPTNHLDFGGKEELKNYLKKKRGFILVSHDREFLDSVVNHILSVNKVDISIEKGNYTTWENNKKLTEEFEQRTSENLQREIAKLESSSVQKREWASISNKQKYHFASNSRTNGVQAYLSQAKRSEERVKKNIQIKKSLLRNYEERKALEFTQDKKDGWIIKIDGLSFSYVESDMLIKNLSLEIGEHDIVWIKGKNGSGKSTLLKLITGQICSPAVAYNGEVIFSILPQEINLKEWHSGLEFLKSAPDHEEEYNSSLQICELFDISEELLRKPCDTYSSGEKKKIYLAQVLSKRNHVIVLDEPLNYMDVMFREQLEKAFELVRPTVLLIEHDAYFLQGVSTIILNLDEGSVWHRDMES